MPLLAAVQDARGRGDWKAGGRPPSAPEGGAMLQFESFKVKQSRAGKGRWSCWWGQGGRHVLLYL